MCFKETECTHTGLTLIKHGIQRNTAAERKTSRSRLDLYSDVMWNPTTDRGNKSPSDCFCKMLQAKTGTSSDFTPIKGLVSTKPKKAGQVLCALLILSYARCSLIMYECKFRRKAELL